MRLAQHCLATEIWRVNTTQERNSPVTSAPVTEFPPSIAGDASSQADADKGVTVLPDPATEALQPILMAMGEWERWFAWHPVHLYMTSRIAWLSTIYRRCVKKGCIESWDYTDAPDEFPSNH
jgi:hypothetical protein